MCEGWKREVEEAEAECGQQKQRIRPQDKYGDQNCYQSKDFKCQIHCTSRSTCLLSTSFYVHIFLLAVAQAGDILCTER
jgi:hypothetical protein